MSGSMSGKMGRKAEISIRVFRAATGKWEDYGVVSSYKKSWKIKNFFKTLFKKIFGGK